MTERKEKRTLRRFRMASAYALALLVVLSLILYPEVAIGFFKTIYSKAVSISDKYSINFAIIFAIFLVCEVLFNAGWILMLKGSGIAKIRLSDLRRRDFKAIDLKNRAVRIGFILNLFGASASWIYLLTIILLNFPWGLKIVSMTPVLWELFIVLSLRLPIAVAIFQGQKRLHGVSETN